MPDVKQAVGIKFNIYKSLLGTFQACYAISRFEQRPGRHFLSHFTSDFVVLYFIPTAICLVCILSLDMERFLSFCILSLLEKSPEMNA